MCAITFVYKVKKKKGKVFREMGLDEGFQLFDYFNDMQKLNPNGGGYFSSSTEEVSKFLENRQELSLNLVNELDKVKRGSYMIAHHRLKSQGGESLLNTQPIQTKHYVIIHNGHLTEKSTTAAESDILIYDKGGFSSVKKTDLLDASDTVKFGKLLDQHQNIDAALQEFNGSYSMFIYEKKTKRLFYTKNRSTDFKFAYLPEFGLIIGATKFDALKKCFIHYEGYFWRETEILMYEPADNSIIDIDEILKFRDPYRDIDKESIEDFLTEFDEQDNPIADAIIHQGDITPQKKVQEIVQWVK
jgi:hypothetical protein